MKPLVFIVLSIWFVGCSRDENAIDNLTVPVHSSRTIHYMHLVIGDSLGYDWTALDTASGAFYAHIEGTSYIRGQTYFKVVDYPVGGGYPITFLLREGSNGDIHALGLFDTVKIENAVDGLLYKTSAQKDSSWDFYFYGDTIKCIMVSRSDTVKTYAGIFRDCLRIRIQYWWGESEDQWLAPGIGLIKRDFETISARPIFMPLLDLKVLRLKSLSRR